MGWYKSILNEYYLVIDNVQKIDKETLETELGHLSDMFRRAHYQLNEFEHDIRQYGVYSFIKARTKTSAVKILEHLNLCTIRADIMTGRALKKYKKENMQKRKLGEKFWVSYDCGKTKIEL